MLTRWAAGGRCCQLSHPARTPTKRWSTPGGLSRPLRPNPPPLPSSHHACLRGQLREAQAALKSGADGFAASPCGWLLKSGEGGLLRSSGFKRRYFRLDCFSLQYFKDETDVKEQGVIHMGSVSHVFLLPPAAGAAGPTIELVTPLRKWVLSGEAERDVVQWAALLDLVVRREIIPQRSAGATAARRRQSSALTLGAAKGAVGESGFPLDTAGGEYDVCFESGPLFLNLESTDSELPLVTGFFVPPSGEPGPAEASGRINPGDVLVGVNGERLSGLTFKQSIGVITSATFPKTLAFRRGSGPDAISAEATGWLLKRGEDGDSALRRRFFQLCGPVLTYHKPAVFGDYSAAPAGGWMGVLWVCRIMAVFAHPPS
jgi:hypothetical protein